MNIENQPLLGGLKPDNIGFGHLLDSFGNPESGADQGLGVIRQNGGKHGAPGLSNQRFLGSDEGVEPKQPTADQGDDGTVSLSAAVEVSMVAGEIADVDGGGAVDVLNQDIAHLIGKSIDPGTRHQDDFLS